ncbi:MAG TPA: AAA family ATPase [Actinophytocola sp.]|uniref:AAA family ATPase n=1 Tax=Actinophytocola sp. TaxID=1872138 RepID=UPI002DBFBDE4|nr:AAA family ATPase [Actinophytocola sp.]HEU5470256.1 AAA family ATPase [Actinophytocola sp.]
MVAARPAGTYEFRVLGDLDVRRDGAQVRLDPVPRRVLARLLVDADRVVPPDLLLADLGGQRATLLEVLADLRRLLAPVLAEEPDGFVLRPGDGLDSRLAEQLIATARAAGEPRAALAVFDDALARWRGASYAGFADTPWAGREAARLDELRRGAIDDRADTAQRLTRRRPEPLPLIGRHAELAVLRGMLDDAEAGRGRVVQVLAPAGAGKTRLGEELARLAVRRGFLALWARSGTGAGARELLAWRGLLATLRKIRPDADAQVPVAVPQPAELAGLLGSLARAEPLVLLFDDLQWLDRPSARLLRSVAGLLGAARVLIWVAGRDLTSAPDGPRIDLRPVGTDEVVAALGRLVPPRVARTIAERSGGSPFVINALVRARAGSSSVDDIPVGAEAVLTEMLGRLDADERSTVDVAAGLGRHLDPGVLAAVLGVPEQTVLATFARLVQDGILRRGVGGDRHSFVHDLIWETAYVSLGPAERAALHGRIADAMIPIATRDRTRVFDVAAHLARAGRAEEAAAWSRRAGNNPADALLGGAVGDDVSGG